MRNQGKPIFDPFAGEEDVKSAYDYNVWRACGTCKGTGKGGATKRCTFCMGYRGRWITVQAHDLTEKEIQGLRPDDRKRAEVQILALRERNRKASIESSADPEWGVS